MVIFQPQTFLSNSILEALIFNCLANHSFDLQVLLIWAF